jgi:signal transduction histidine kinase
MAAHITHEIRNPLSAMSLNLELLESELSEGAADEAALEKRELVKAIKAEAQRLARLSEQYLSLARRPSPTLANESISDLLAELVEFLGVEMKRAKVHVALVVEPDVPDVPLDESLARQAFLNLMRNAREAMQDGGRLTITVKKGELGVEVLIEDDGPGIPDAVRASVFDPFFTTKERGTGLGLAVTREIVEAHGGSISCSPRLPRGTTFRLCFRGSNETAPLSAHAG